jgi:Ca2+-binding EF-hand superfamily protein
LWPPVKRSNFANHNKLKRQAMKVIAATMPADEIAGLREIFKSIDADGSGTITEEELSSALREKGSLLRREDLEGLLALVDQDSSGCIDYEEFLAATLSQHQMEKAENMRAAFAHFDIDGSGNITKDELRQALKVCARVRQGLQPCMLARLTSNGLPRASAAARHAAFLFPPFPMFSLACQTAAKQRLMPSWRRWTRMVTARSATTSLWR